MKIVRMVPSRLKEYPVDGAGSDIQEGAVLMPGSGANQLSAAILATGAAADAIGILSELHDFSVSGDYDPEAGTNYPKRQVYEFYPGCEVAAEYDQDTVLDVASYSSPDVNITSFLATRPGGWLYVVSGTGAGQLGYIDSSSSGTATLKSGLTTDLDNTSKVLYIRELFSALHTMSSDTTKIITSVANGSLPWVCLKNQFKYDGQEGWIDMDPTQHHDLQIAGTNPVFRAIFSPRDTLKNPGS